MQEQKILSSDFALSVYRHGHLVAAESEQFDILVETWCCGERFWALDWEEGGGLAHDMLWRGSPVEPFITRKFPITHKTQVRRI